MIRITPMYACLTVLAFRYRSGTSDKPTPPGGEFNDWLKDHADQGDCLATWKAAHESAHAACQERERVLREALESIEWGHTVQIEDYSYDYCPRCLRMKETGHESYCGVGMALKAAHQQASFDTAQDERGEGG